MAEPEFLFVYGTLRRGSNNDMCRLLAAHAHYLSQGWFRGRLYGVSYYPCVVPSDLQQDRVLGEVYELTDPAGILPRLDDYEECSEQYPEPREYRREKRSITLAGGKTVDAWIYLYNRDAGKLSRIESGDFFNQLSPA